MKSEQIQTPILFDLPIDELGPNERLDHESAIIAERRMKAARLYAAKKPMRAIAAELRCSLGTVHADIHFVVNHWRKAAIQDVGHVLAIELLRLESIEEQFWQLAELSREQGDLTAVGHHLDSMLGIIKIRCNLLGLTGGKGIPGRENDSPKVLVKLVAGVDPMELV
jgi:hypothetical protein